MAESGKAGKALWPCVEQFDEVFVVQIWQLSQRNNAVYSAASPVFLQKLNKISSENNIDFYLSIGADKKDIQNIDSSDFNVIS